MFTVRRWFLLGGAALTVFLGFVFGIYFMLATIKIFDIAITNSGNDLFLLVRNLAQGIKGILGWIVFGITMTNAVVISSTLCLTIMLGGQQKN